MSTTNSAIFLLIALSAAVSAGKIEKRSLVSRFTSNPFFLSHFSGHYDDYERGTWVAEPEIEPSERFTYNVFTNHIAKEKESTTTEQVITSTEQEKIDEEDVRPLFNSLPLYDRATVFRKKEDRKQTSAPSVQEQGTEKSQQSKDTGLMFSWPRVTGTVEVKEETKDVPNTKNEVVVYLFKSLPLFDRANVFKTVPEQKKTVNEEPKHGHVYIFKSLPLYDRSHPFRHAQPAPFVSKKLEVTAPTTKPTIRRKKVLKVVRRKKYPAAPDEVTDSSETGPGKIESIADIPLEDFHKISYTLYNSYGESLSPPS